MVFVSRGCLILLTHSHTQVASFFSGGHMIFFGEGQDFLSRDCMILCVKRLHDLLCEEVA